MAGKRVLEKRLRMTLDFEVSVEELTEESLREYFERYTSSAEILGDVELWANVCRQIRLQRALLEDEVVLGRYLTFAATVEVDGSNNSQLAGVFGVGGDNPEEDIFGPLFSELEPEDESFYRAVSAEGILYEQIEPLSMSVRAKWVGARLEEIRAMAEGLFDDSSE